MSLFGEGFLFLSLFGNGRVVSQMHRGQEWFVVLFMDRDVLGKETEMVITRCITSSQALAIQKRYKEAINESVHMLAPMKFTATGQRSTKRNAGAAFRKHHDINSPLSSSTSQASSEEPLVK
jgi:hypothetical protein